MSSAALENALDGARVLAELKTRRLGRELRLLDVVDSTQAVLKSLALAGEAGYGCVVVAEQQRAGRGRGGHRWESPRGAGLYFTALFRLPPKHTNLPLLSLAASVSLCRLLETLGIAPRIKWPNDVLVGGRKIAGILCELLPERGLLVGVGLNVGLEPERLDGLVSLPATSLAAELDPWDVPGRESLLARLLGELERAESEFRTEPELLHRAWASRWGDRGRWFRILAGPQGASRGQALELTPEGGLLLKVPGRASPLQLLSGTLIPEADESGAEGS